MEFQLMKHTAYNFGYMKFELFSLNVPLTPDSTVIEPILLLCVALDEFKFTFLTGFSPFVPLSNIAGTNKVNTSIQP